METNNYSREAGAPGVELEHLFSMLFEQAGLDDVIRRLCDWCADGANCGGDNEVRLDAELCQRTLAGLLEALERRRLLKQLWRKLTDTSKTARGQGGVDKDLLALVRRVRAASTSQKALLPL